MIDCSKCKYLIKYLGLYDPRYKIRSWQYLCGAKVTESLKHKRKGGFYLRSLTRRKCKYVHDEQQKELISVLNK